VKTKTKIREVAPPPKLATLGNEVDRLFERSYHRCDHEQEIADRIEADVRKLLERFGLLDLAEDEDVAPASCRFCASKEWVLQHKSWCVESGQ
jgi:hypothetical protein